MVPNSLSTIPGLPAKHFTPARPGSRFFSWLFARMTAAEFHLRVEDTDTEGKITVDESGLDKRPEMAGPGLGRTRPAPKRKDENAIPS